MEGSFTLENGSESFKHTVWGGTKPTLSLLQGADVLQAELCSPCGLDGAQGFEVTLRVRSSLNKGPAGAP